MTIYYILKPFDYPAESIVTTPIFPLEEPHSAPRRLDFGPIVWQITQSRPVPNLNVHEYARFHGRDEVLVGEHNP